MGKTTEERFAVVVEALGTKPGVSHSKPRSRLFGRAALKVHDKIFAMVSYTRHFVVKLPKARVDALVISRMCQRLDADRDRLNFRSVQRTSRSIRALAGRLRPARWLAAAALMSTPWTYSQDRTDRTDRTNYYNDPFVQVTSSIAACPVPTGPLVSADEAKAESHWRVERGTSCFQTGRCRLPNAYLYDKEIVPRVAQFLRQSDLFDNTSIWIYGQRRWVFVMGCVSSQKQGMALEQAVRRVDDVEAVVPQWMVGVDKAVPYTVVSPAR